MKIIGEGPSGTLLLEASPKEIANLFGFYWEGQLREAGITLKPGMTIDTNAEYEKLAWLRRRNKDFDDLIVHLRRTADHIENNKGAFDAVIGDKPHD